MPSPYYSDDLNPQDSTPDPSPAKQDTPFDKYRPKIREALLQNLLRKRQVEAEAKKEADDKAALQKLTKLHKIAPPGKEKDNLEAAMEVAWVRVRSHSRRRSGYGLAASAGGKKMKNKKKEEDADGDADAGAPPKKKKGTSKKEKIEKENQVLSLQMAKFLSPIPPKKKGPEQKPGLETLGVSMLIEQTHRFACGNHDDVTLSQVL